MKLYRYYTKTRRVITCGATVVVADVGLWRLIGRPRPGAHDARRTRTHLAIGGPRLMRFGRVFESERSWWPVFTAVWQTAASTRARHEVGVCTARNTRPTLTVVRRVGFYHRDTGNRCGRHVRRTRVSIVYLVLVGISSEHE